MKKINLDFIKIITSSSIFIVSLFFKDYNVLNLVLLVISYIVISYEMYLKFFENICKREFFDENFLMIIATLGAFFIGEYDEALMVMLLFNLGEYLSDKAIDNSEKSIIQLMDLRSDFINIKVDNEIKKTAIEEVNINDIFVVKPGEKIGLDGMVVEGEGNIDTSSLTGESLPRHVKENMTVLSGSTNLNSVLVVKATSTYKTSTANKILELIENSETKKTETEKFITRFSKIYTPVVVLCAVFLTVIPVSMGMPLNEWLYRSLVFLVTSCPCALIISVPLGFFSGIGRASKEGILVKGSNELENLSKIKTIAFDKTGTITKGNFIVQKIFPININEDELVEIVAYSEYYSNHPIAKVMLDNYKFDIDKNRIKSFEEISGKGVSVKLDNDNILVGNYSLLNDNGIKIDIIDEAGTVIYIAKNNIYLGYIIIADEIKNEAYKLVTNLKQLGINKLIILSGDNQKFVTDVSNKIGIKEYYFEMLPVDKVKKIEELKKETFTAFVGDGINDAPVMKISDLGIAMGGIGSDAAIEASSVVLMTDNLNKISEAIRISKRTKNIVNFNIVFALTIKFLFLLLGTFGITKIWYAVIADVGVTLLLVLNSLRLIITKK